MSQDSLLPHHSETTSPDALIRLQQEVAALPMLPGYQERFMAAVAIGGRYYAHRDNPLVDEGDPQTIFFQEATVAIMDTGDHDVAADKIIADHPHIGEFIAQGIGTHLSLHESDADGVAHFWDTMFPPQNELIH